MAWEANCILPSNSAIADADASWHNGEALADLRHGIFCPWEQRPTWVFWKAYLSPRATGG
jgi:hypothetical protein